MSAKDVIAGLMADDTDPDMRSALRSGYRLGLVAAIEEVEKTASALPDAMRSDLLKLAVRIRSRVLDLTVEEPTEHVRTVQP